MCTMIVSAAMIAHPTGTKECPYVFYDVYDVNECAILLAPSSGSHLQGAKYSGSDMFYWAKA